MQGILTDVPLMPTGGVTVDSAGDYLAAGAFAVGLGGQLGSDDDVARGDRRTVIDRARSLSQLAQPAA
jgi:2-dehydro-3-deoxyphosphogluconate aldolase/(4S)-4-hydroxy-2-oxoglutarate aldolase